MFKLLVLLIALPSLAFSQATKPAPPPSATVCMPVAQAAKVRDSLSVLPLVRKEATAWRVSAGHYKQAADTSFAAYLKQVSATSNTRLALREQQIETARQESKASEWKAKARRRGLWNWLAGAAVAGLTLGFVAR